MFISLVSSFYLEDEDEAYEVLHLQTKQIKDELTLQIKSDRENLITMANFAAKLYADGEDYHLMFASFKPIGMVLCKSPSRRRMRNVRKRICLEAINKLPLG